MCCADRVRRRARVVSVGGAIVGGSWLQFVCRSGKREGVCGDTVVEVIDVMGTCGVDGELHFGWLRGGGEA